MSALRLDAVSLRVGLELRNPFCYLAIAPTRALAAELGLEVDWLPLTSPPLKAPSQPGPDDDRGIRHRRNRAAAVARDVATYADAQGLVVRDLYRAPDPEPAQRAWLWLREHDPARLPAYLDTLFRDYWAATLDPSQPAQIERALEAVGAERDTFAAWSTREGDAAARGARQVCEQNGWTQSPLFLVDEEPFIGRQHLPMIRWILEGRSGPVPI